MLLIAARRADRGAERLSRRAEAEQEYYGQQVGFDISKAPRPECECDGI